MRDGVLTIFPFYDVVLVFKGIFQNTSEKELVINNKDFRFCLLEYPPTGPNPYIKDIYREYSFTGEAAIKERHQSKN